ncbi:MAG: M3 family metallopeptidase [Mariprofundaceae bacterium]|nr:M3 family metallopeptidase [Mariprofundaceae bacterium]
MTNPLLTGIDSPLPLFPEIKADYVLPALEHVIAENKKDIEKALACDDVQTFLAMLDTLDERLHKVWSPVSHMQSVADTPELREVYSKAAMLVSAYASEVAQNKALFKAMKDVQQSAAFADLPKARQKAIEDELRAFTLAGADLNDADQQTYKKIQMRLTQLSNEFSQHVLDATQAFSLHLEAEEDVNGLPEFALSAARALAKKKDLDGYVFTLDAPSYMPFMEYAHRRDLREQMYRAYVSRASSGDLDNTPLIEETLKLRQEKAQLLGFPHYTALSLATKMAESTEQVVSFLRELAQKSRPFAEKEFQDLREFAATHLHMDEFEAWDVPYASEKLREHQFSFSQEEVRQYFPRQKVLAGLFQLVEKLYAIDVRPAKAPVWHEDVQYFDILNAQGDVVAGFYLDAFAREAKRGGAWMDECMIRWQKPNGDLQIPVAYLVCNFSAPLDGKDACWSHDEVITLFHEFGHGLHHMLTEQDILPVSGIRGVPWDAVELPSQFMENFCWQQDVLAFLSSHHETGESLPQALLKRMFAAKDFHSALQMLRQIEFSLFDVLLHSQAEATQSVQEVLDAVRAEVAVLCPPAFNQFQNSFSHIFAGGYAAGYFSYKWAEVLSSDVFAAFEEEGIFNQDVAQRFRDSILSAGGSRDMMDNFVAFRGRKPELDALLRHSGLAGDVLE